jgi:hypothetical protein
MPCREGTEQEGSRTEEAAARLVLRASLLKPPATAQDHYLMPKHLSRIAHGEHKGERGRIRTCDPCLKRISRPAASVSRQAQEWRYAQEFSTVNR